MPSESLWWLGWDPGQSWNESHQLQGLSIYGVGPCYQEPALVVTMCHRVTRAKPTSEGKSAVDAGKASSSTRRARHARLARSYSTWAAPEIRVSSNIPGSQGGWASNTFPNHKIHKPNGNRWHHCRFTNQMILLPGLVSSGPWEAGGVHYFTMTLRSLQPWNLEIINSNRFE